MKSEYNKALVSILKTMRETISEQVSPEGQVPMAAPRPKMKPRKVIFDKSTNAPFEAVFSERGFEIDDTRLSFEELETAISKNYNITLNNGKGLVLDAVKMQKILKYKDIY
jgi:hypothetical protein